MGFVRTVPEAVWQAVAAVTTEAFADSYLYGGEIRDGLLEPRTVIAFDALRGDTHIIAALKRQGVALKRPEPWRDGNGKRTAGECFGALSDAPIRKRARAA